MTCPKNFTLAELLHSDTAEIEGISNFPTWEHADNLYKLGQHLQAVRDLLGHSMKINSGYRCEALNNAVGGSKTSSHSEGLAADFTCAGFGTPKEICEALWATDIKFDQLIDEGTWVHIGFREPMRVQYLKADFSTNPTSYVKVKL